MTNFTRERLFSLVWIALLALAIGCSIDREVSFEEAQYKGLSATQVIYDSMWSEFVKHYENKTLKSDGTLLVDEEAFQRGLVYANRYYDAWMAWIDAVIVYEANKTEGNLATTKDKLLAFQEASTVFLEFIRPLVLKKGGDG